MSLDISAFRSIAAQSPDRLVYVSGQKLKSAKTQGTRGPEAFKAAVDAFVKAYGDHYGAKLGNMSRQSLQEFADGSKPLTASVVKQMLDYADGKVGSAHVVTVAGTEIDISKIGTEKIPFQGFSRTTKSDRAWKGQGQAVKDALATLACKDGGKIDPKALLKALSTAHEYTRLELSVTGESTPAAIGDRKNRVFAAAVRALDNKTLSAVYQGIASRETDALKDELARLMSHPDVSGETQMLAEQEFADICRLESLVLQQVSERILTGDKGPRREGDVTATNLGLLVGAAAKGAIGAKDAEKAVESTLASHGMDSVEARQIGDTIRNNELTINMHLKYLLGWEGLDKGKEKPSFLQPGGQVLNAFQVQEAIGEPPTGGYLQLRNEVETQLFPEYAEEKDAEGKVIRKETGGKDRPVYAALNVGKITSGAADTAFATYGRAVVVLKEHVKKQCTYTFGDTFFVERFAIKAEDFDGFLRNAVEDFADAIADKEAALAALRGDNMLKSAFGTLVSSAARDGKVVWNSVKTFAGPMAKALARLAKEGAVIDEDGVEAVFMKHYADFGEAQRKVATYDNVETLFAQGTDFSAVKMAIGTLQRQNDPKTPLHVDGADYIEAQIHAPVSFATDVAEIRINVQDVTEHFKAEFDALDEAERAAIESNPSLGADAEARRNAWINAKSDAEIARIKEMTKDAPFPVTFYNVAETLNAETDLRNAANRQLRNETYGHFKNEVEAAAARLKTPQGRNSLIPDLCRKIDLTLPGADLLFALYGQDLSRLPRQAFNGFDAALNKKLAEAAKKNNNVVVEGAEGLRKAAVQPLLNNVNRIISILHNIRTAGVTDEKEIRALAQQILAAKVAPRCVAAYVKTSLAGKNATANLVAFATEAYAKFFPDGAQLLKDAFNGLPLLGDPKASAFCEEAAKLVIRGIEDAKKAIAKLSDGDRKKADELAAGVEERIGRKLAEFIRKRAELLAAKKDLPFPGEAERNAFISWATRAGKIRNEREIQGTYEASGIIADELEAKLKKGGTLTPKDLVDAFNAVKDLCKGYIAQDQADHKARNAEFGPDDKNTWITRAASVALSRLAARIGLENAKKLAESLNSPAVRYLALATRTAVKRVDLGYLSVFLDTFYQRAPETLGVKIPYFFLPRGMTYSSVAPGTRDLLATVNAPEAQSLATEFPYKPGEGGVSSFRKIAAPANPAGMPQTLQERKKFLRSMLPIYHKNELPGGFDYAHNTHGRAHATRAFIFSVVMGNILKEKGVAIDDNAGCLAAAGHDSGRFQKGKDTEEQETASAANTEHFLRAQFHDAPGEEWIDATKKNICAPDDDNTQRTIEGYIFKSADSIEISRLGDVDMKKFPFLREPLLTEDGLVILPDEELRKALVKEAEALARMTSPNTRKVQESIELTFRFAQMRPGPERDALNAESEKAKKDGRILEAQQAETMSDDELVAMIEKTIRDNPATFPLLNKYYH